AGVRDEVRGRLLLAARLDVDEQLHRVVADQDTCREQHDLQSTPSPRHAIPPALCDCKGSADHADRWSALRCRGHGRFEGRRLDIELLPVLDAEAEYTDD